MKGLKRPKVYGDVKYEKLRTIIDCTEFYIEKPSLPSSLCCTSSQYKSNNTLKLLVSISPICHFNFVSKLYTGCISDKQIVKASGFLEFIKPDDSVMADKGFNIQDLLARPIMAKNNVSARGSTATRRVARGRVHVECMIRKLKCYRILKGVITLTLKAYITSIVRVCAALVNLQPSLIRFEDDSWYCGSEKRLANSLHTLAYFAANQSYRCSTYMSQDVLHYQTTPINEITVELVYTI